MSQHSRRRGVRNVSFRAEPSSVIIALLITIALATGLGGGAMAVGLESSSTSAAQPAESIDPEAHVPGARYVSEKSDSHDNAIDGLLGSLDQLNQLGDELSDQPAVSAPIQSETPGEDVAVEDNQEQPSPGDPSRVSNFPDSTPSQACTPMTPPLLRAWKSMVIIRRW